MPEGDTVHRLAMRIGSDLSGRTVDRLWVQGHGDIEDLRGATITSVEARGKHLLLHLQGDWSLRVHLGMKGRWFRRRSATRPGRGGPAVRIVSGPTSWECRGAYQAELVRTPHLKSHPRLSRLGPDVLADPLQLQEIVERALLPAHASREVGDLVTDQRIACGVGNVYKSEVLFMEGVHPRTPVARLDRAAMTRIYQTANRVMAHNLRTKQRETVPLRERPTPASPRLWVYGRDGEPCLRCRSTVQRIMQEGRSTYLCPSCQARNEAEDATSTALPSTHEVRAR